MTLRSQSQTMSQEPHLTEADSDPIYQPTEPIPVHGMPHLIPPDITTMKPTNFRQLAVNQLVADHLFKSHHVHHVFNEITGERETMDTLLRGIHGIQREQSLTNEWDRLADGKLNRVKGTKTIEFISAAQVPSGRKVTYGNFVCDHRPLKTEPNRVRLTVGGDKLDYPFDASSPASNMIDAKLLLNSTISDAHRGARFMSADLKDFFLNTSMERAEYMKIQFKYFPQAIRTAYNLEHLVTSQGWIYIKIKKGMYGLKQAARIAYDLLKRRLATHGYTPCKENINFWKHQWRPTKFSLCVDDFGIKYFHKRDADHLLTALNKYYKITTDWTGANYLGLTITWNYNAGWVDISLPDYIKKVLHKFQHSTPTKIQHAPHQWTEPVYGKTRQYAIEKDTDPTLNPTDKKLVQQISGNLLYYARAIESSILPALNEISHSQATPTSNTMQKCKMLLDFCATHPTPTIRFNASDMILHVDTYAAYLVLPGSKSRIAGYFYLSNHPPFSRTPTPCINGAIHVECKTLKHVVASAAEAETGGLFINSQLAIPIRQSLEALGHIQPPTPIKTDNSTAYKFVHNDMKQKISKSWDMRFNWLRDRSIIQKLLNIYWAKGTNNWADYFTKHHVPSHHRGIRPLYIYNG